MNIFVALLAVFVMFLVLFSTFFHCLRDLLPPVSLCITCLLHILSWKTYGCEYERELKGLYSVFLAFCCSLTHKSGVETGLDLVRYKALEVFLRIF